jgi:hypothetical protein
MENEFVSYEQALELNELGFDENCFCIYNRERKIRFNNLYNPMDRNKNAKLTSNNGRYPAPLYQQAFKWFRENYDLYGTIRYGNNEFDNSIYLFPCVNGVIVGNDSFRTQEEAELECLKKLIEIVKNK